MTKPYGRAVFAVNLLLAGRGVSLSSGMASVILQNAKEVEEGEIHGVTAHWRECASFFREAIEQARQGDWRNASWSISGSFLNFLGGFASPDIHTLAARLETNEL